MSEKIKIAVLGYGNLGRGVELAARNSKDLELSAVFSRRNPSEVKTCGAPVFSADEILKAIDLMPENCIIVLFLHSFNFLNLKYSFKDKKYVTISINDKLINEYKRLLASIADKTECKFSSIKDLDMGGLSSGDFAPAIHVDADMIKYAKDKFRLKFMRAGDI